MDNTELVKILRVFDTELRSRFLAFLDSPYCTEGVYTKSMSRMVQKIFELFDKEDEGEMDEREIYLHVYPEKQRADNQDLSNLRSYTMKLLRRFIIMEESLGEGRESANKVHLAFFFAKRGLETYSERELKWLDEWSSNDTIAWDDQDYLTNLQYAQTLSFHQNKFNKVKGDIGLFNFLDKINAAFLYIKLKYANMLYAYQHQINIEEIHGVNKFPINISSTESKAFYATPIGSLMALCNEFLKPSLTPNMEAYKAFREEYIELEDKLHINDRMNFAAFSRVFLAKCLDSGDDSFIRPLFEEQKSALKKQPKSAVSFSFFYSTLKIGLILNELDWTEEFVRNYRNKIEGSPKKIEETLALCSATLLFKKQYHNEAILPLVTTSFTDMQLKNIAKTLEIKILYEANNEQVHNRVKAAKMYFRRVPGLVDSHQIGFRKFVSIMKRLLNPDIGVDRLKSLRLRKAILEEQILAERIWLKEVINRKCAQWN